MVNWWFGAGPFHKGILRNSKPPSPTTNEPLAEPSFCEKNPSLDSMLATGKNLDATP